MMLIALRRLISRTRRDLHLLLVILIGVLHVVHNNEVVGAIWVDFDLAELAGGDVILEENIKISVCKTLKRKSVKIRDEDLAEAHTFGSGRRK